MNMSEFVDYLHESGEYTDISRKEISKIVEATINYYEHSSPDASKHKKARNSAWKQSTKNRVPFWKRIINFFKGKRNGEDIS